MRRLHLCLCFSACVPFAVAVAQTAQSAGPPPHTSANVEAILEVAVVRVHPASVMHNDFRFSKNRFDLEDQPLLKLIAFAYGLNPRQVVGAAAWMTDSHFDMSGTTNLTDDATLPQEQQLLRQLLKERFALRFHRETQEMPAFALQVVKGQPRLTRAADASAQPIEWTEGHNWARTENFRSNSMGDFIVFQQLFMDRPVVDQTALTGSYDFKLTYSYGTGPESAAEAAPPMFTAIKEQLGLKFEPVRVPVEAFVIDHIEQPTSN